MTNWNDELVAQLEGLVGDESPVTQETVASVAEELDISKRSASAKLRKMGYDVEKVGARGPKFSESETSDLSDYLDSNSGEQTYAEIAKVFAGGKFTAKQVQGKVLSMERTGDVAETPKVEAKRIYTLDQEAIFVKMARAGAYLEDIADAVKMSVASVRGKALSLCKANDLDIPKQRDSHAKTKVDPLTALGDISDLTVEEIAEKIEKSPRGVRQMITYRGLECANYKAKARKEKAAA